MPVRVMVQDAWDQVTLNLSPATPVDEAKRKALTMTHTSGDPAGFVVKYRGAELFDESKSLADLGVVSNAALIVLPRQRRPVR
jgi:hypothetical protein